MILVDNKQRFCIYGIQKTLWGKFPNPLDEKGRKMDKEIRDLIIPIRVSFSEKRRMQDRAEKVGRKLSGFIRDSALGCEIIEKPDNETFYKFIKALRSVERAMNNIGREAHTLRFFDEPVLKKEREELNRLIIEIKKSFL